MEKEYIKKEAWSKILTFLQGCPKVYVGKEEKCKRFIESVFWMARTGAQWRELPDAYGKWNSVFKRFNEWSKNQVWDDLLKFCAQDPDLEYIIIDATILRAHACAAGYGDQETEGLGRSKGGFSCKLHVKVDSLGNLLQLIITAGQHNHITQADALLKDVAGSYVIADKGYDSNELRANMINIFTKNVMLLNAFFLK